MPADTRTPATRAVQLAPEQGVSYNLDAFPEDRYNRLIPTQTITMPSDLVVPVVQIVQLDPDTDRGGDVYTSRDIGSGKGALTRVGLRKVATAAAVNIVDSRRTDDGSDPAICEWAVTAEMVLPTGQRIRAIGTKRIVLDDQHWASDAQRAKFRSALAEHTAARAENRAIRSLLSLRGSYPLADLRKPFAVVTYAPNMNHPDVRARILDAMAPTVQALYGPEQAKQLTAGETVTEVPQAADDDEAQYVERPANGGTHSVDAQTGEVMATTESDEPDWLLDEPTEQSAPDLASRLHAVARANAHATGPATNEQRQAIKGVLRGLKNAEAGAVLADLFDIGNLSAIEQRHAQAILEVGAAMGHERLVEEWRALAAELG